MAGATRLFVGGLSAKVNSQLLQQQFQRYGDIASVDLKEKKDPEGNIITRFAYISLNTNQQKIHECVSALNGSSWKGSKIRVEQAKESFIDRLKRERTQQQENQDNPSNRNTLPQQYNHSNNSSWNDHQNKSIKPNFSQIEHQRNNIITKSSVPLNDIKHKHEDLSKSNNKRKSSKFEEKTIIDVSPKKVKKEKKEIVTHTDEKDSDSIENMHGLPMFKGLHMVSKKSNEKSVQVNNQISNKTDAEMMSSFKEFSSVWADPEEENYDNDSARKQNLGIFVDFRGASSDKVNSAIAHKKSKKQSEVKSHMTKPLTTNDVVDEDNLSDSDGESSDSSTEEPYKGHQDLQQEQAEQIGILSQVLGKPIEAVNKKYTENVGLKPVTRYDPTLPQHQVFQIDKIPLNNSSTDKKDDKYVKVSDNLNFASSDQFSIMSLFAKRTEDDDQDIITEETTTTSNVAPTNFLSNVGQNTLVRKTKSFFIKANDPLIQSGANWMTQVLTDRVIEQFAKHRYDLTSVYKTRHARAQQNAKYIKKIHRRQKNSAK